MLQSPRYQIFDEFNHIRLVVAAPYRRIRLGSSGPAGACDSNHRPMNSTILRPRLYSGPMMARSQSNTTVMFEFDGG